MENREIWKKVDIALDYEVSTKGNIRSLKNNKTKLLKPCISNNGYLIIRLCVNGKVKTKTLHRLIALTFFSNLENKPQVNHINGIKTDNRLKNLEWCTAKQNTQHAVKLNLFHFSNERKEILAKRSCKKVINLLNNDIYKSVKYTALKFNLNPIVLASKLNGRRKNNTNFKYYIENDK